MISFDVLIFKDFNMLQYLLFVGVVGVGGVGGVGGAGGAETLVPSL
jgi:hypothetical protein